MNKNMSWELWLLRFTPFNKGTSKLPLHFEFFSIIAFIFFAKKCHGKRAFDSPAASKVRLMQHPRTPQWKAVQAPKQNEPPCSSVALHKGLLAVTEVISLLVVKLRLLPVTSKNEHDADTPPRCLSAVRANGEALYREQVAVDNVPLRQNEWKCCDWVALTTSVTTIRSMAHAAHFARRETSGNNKGNQEVTRRRAKDQKGVSFTRLREWNEMIFICVGSMRKKDLKSFIKQFVCFMKDFLVFPFLLEIVQNLSST